MINTFFIDFHCHATMKPYGRSFTGNKANSQISADRITVFSDDPPTLWDKLLNISSTLTKFSQSSIPALKKGNVKVIGASLYPIEKGFLNSKMGTGCLPDALLNFVTGVGLERIEFIQQNHDYFADLQSEYHFLEKFNGIPTIIEQTKVQYKLVKDINQIKDNAQNQDVETISIIPTIEGSHVFDSHTNRRAEEDEILVNVKKLKGWEYRPLFITMGHHFYNQMCGHCQSLSGSLNKILDQNYGIHTGFTSLGWVILDALLDNTNNDRIHIDVKHMSVKSRKEYYKYLKSKPDVPVIVSHGAVNGLASFDNRQNTNFNRSTIFNQSELNFFDDEILLISASGGIFCIQLDERRIADKIVLKKSLLNLTKKKMLFEKSRLVWNQIRHIGEILDKKGKNAWNIAGLGSDFDGIVDPLNGFWTSEEFPSLAGNLLKHAKEYMCREGKKLRIPENRNAEPEEIVRNVMCENIMAFLQNHFK